MPSHQGGERLCVRTMRGTDDADIGREDRYTRWQMNEDMQVRRNQKTIELLKDTEVRRWYERKIPRSYESARVRLSNLVNICQGHHQGEHQHLPHQNGNDIERNLSTSESNRPNSGEPSTHRFKSVRIYHQGVATTNRLQRLDTTFRHRDYDNCH